MVIKKIYNNNIVLVEDEKQLEMILLGRGIAFQKKAGDEIDPGRAEKRFVIDSPELTSRFSELVKEVPVNHLELSCRI
ncbi:CAT RNA binding domain-containing protein, partial [Enterocloster asparagiformis]